MRTALRKMGNSTGMIVPKSILRELGLESGATLELRVELGELAARPVVNVTRPGWAEAAARIGDAHDPESESWLGVPVEGDAHLEW